jgi:predicted transcriptional regulator
MAKQTGTLQLSDADISFLLNLLRNASSPMTTAELIEALRQRSGR